MKRLTIGWKVATLNSAIASFRYRALLPGLALETFGIKNKIFSNACPSQLPDLDVLVIVKSFNVEDYLLAQAAVKWKIPVIFDLCDNIFIADYAGKKKILPPDVFLLISGIANAITVTTEPLAKIVQSQVGTNIPVYVIPDSIETKESLTSVKKQLFVPQVLEIYKKLKLKTKKKVAKFLQKSISIFKTGNIIAVLRIVIKLKIRPFFKYFTWQFYIKLAYRHFDYWRARLTGRPPKLEVKAKAKAKKQAALKHAKIEPINIPETAKHSKKILWFGNHGAKYAKFGMLDLLLIREPLEKLASEMPLELIVVSNNFEKYKKHIQPMAIPSRYIEWSTSSSEESLHSADVVVLPNSLDDFSICKSSNRSVLALSNGVPVVATSTPSLEALEDCIILDDFEQGLRRYLTDADFAKQQVEKGQKLIEQLYGQQAIGGLWKGVIDNVISNNELNNVSESNDTDLIIAIHLPQDVALAYPLIEEAKQQGLQCSIWTSLSAIKRWPSLLKTIKSWGENWRILSDNLAELDVSGFPSTAFALLSVTESNLNPHRFTHGLTKYANTAGLFTATIQHGFENIGLTYSDEVHDIKRINFASRKIYIWGNPENLHADISQETRKKCYSAGCPKPAVAEQTALPNWDCDNQVVIGIFENLHWHRYSDDYRSFFIESVNHIANRFSNIIFLVKPHNAGMWLTARYKGDVPVQNNVIIADPMSEQWANITAPQILDHLTAVITTPSTVALDAARVSLPTAVVGYDLELDNYSPLPIIKNIDGWSAFLDQVLNDKEKTYLQKRSQKFVDRVMLPSEKSAWRIVSDLKSYSITYNQEKNNAA